MHTDGIRSSSSPCEAPCPLLVGGEAATGGNNGGDTRVFGSSAAVWVAARVRGKGGATVGGGTINRTTEAALACGPREVRRGTQLGAVRGQARARIWLGRRGERDNRRVPPVICCARGRVRWAALGRSTGWAAELEDDEQPS